MKVPHGTIRQSQLITTYGPGAMVDLPRHSIVVGGLDDWSFGDHRLTIAEDRLVAKVEELLKVQGVQLVLPPVESSEPGAAALTGIPGWLFPEWFVAQYEEPRGAFRARPLVHRRALVNDRYEGPDGRRYPVVPVRFVQGCENGHLSDIDWRGFVHAWSKEPCRRPLWIEERGSTGDLSEVFVECECGKARSMAIASQAWGAESLGFCNGHRPWLGPAAGERCGGADGKPKPNRLLLRHASDAYFPQVLRVISIPHLDSKLRIAVEAVWEDFLSIVESIEELPRERRRPRVASALAAFDDKAVWAEVQRRRGVAPGAGAAKKIKQAEIETLTASRQEIGDDLPEGADFHARRIDVPASPLLAAVDRVVLVHRLREVMALVGFTRFEPAIPDIEGELSLDVKRAPLARDVNWVPAVENRGEGFFLGLRREALAGWLARPAVEARGAHLRSGFEAWARRHTLSGSLGFPGLPYYLLHSLSHLLITAVSLECGYAASSIRERIYATEAGYGILLYTGSPDAEGTLGGLVEVGRHLDRHLANALRLGLLCANDPVCAQHEADNQPEERFLHGAACHGCLLIAEPSCERQNEFLDRALVVPTVTGAGAEFFAAAG